MTQEHIDYMLSKIPRNRFAKVDELASLVCWLSCEENSFTTSAVFDLEWWKSYLLIIMQIGIDVGATKIESVVLEERWSMKDTDPEQPCPKDYLAIIRYN